MDSEKMKMGTRASVKANTPENVASEYFRALYAEWLTNRARYQTDPNWTNETENRHCDREEELARLITTTPCTSAYEIFQKIEVLEYYMTGCEGGSSWADNREFVMLAGIKADLRRFPPGQEGEV